MSQAYSDPSRERDLEIFQLTSDEAAELADEDTVMEARKNLPRGCIPEMNSRDWQKLVDAIREITGDMGGWYWQACFPGCLPDGDPMGPFDSYAAALADARSYDFGD